MLVRRFALTLAWLVGAALLSAETARRPLRLEDLGRLRDVEDPQISPDGAWVAYTVTAANFDEDRNDTDVWMTSWDGSRTVRLTTSKEPDRSPRWSPDGKYLAFRSGRESESGVRQVWLLDRLGGEPQRITDFPGGVSDLEWSPDGARLALIVDDPDPAKAAAAAEKEKEKVSGKEKRKTLPPIVVDRFQFKEDETGYLGVQRSHLYLFHVATRKADPLTPGGFNESQPSWSPQGDRIAFVSKRGSDFDRDDNYDVYVIEARAGARPRRLTDFEGADSHPDWSSPPQWSPDGKWIAYLQGGAPRLIYYGVQKLAVVSSSGGPARLVTRELDRNVFSPRWSDDGTVLHCLVEDDGTMRLSSFPAAGGSERRVLDGKRVVSAFEVARGGRIAVLASTLAEPPEVFAVEEGGARRLTRQNDGWLSEVRLAKVEEIRFGSKDGTEIHGFLVLPADAGAGRPLPAVLQIHGGPVSQSQHEFDFVWHLFAARGYAVIAANPRGSSGRGEKFSEAIYAAWGEKDLEDVLAAVDHAVSRGVADPARLGVGGWSYGGILTNYAIAKDARFKAAVSGAGASNILAGYGTDQYIREYETELGPPWRNPEPWIKLSYPFLHADRISTPTLFLCGEKDFNVPLLNSEQMFQALKSLGRQTQLVIYPGEFHSIRTPSYRRDRYERSLAWYERFLPPR